MSDSLCKDCGACCRTQGYPPFESRDGIHDPSWETLRLIRFDLATEVLLALAIGNRHGGPCLWLNEETMQCNHYHHRPNVCREMLDPGDDTCNGWRGRFGLTPLTIGQTN